MGTGQHQRDFLAGGLAAVAAGIVFGKTMSIPLAGVLAAFLILLALSLVLARKGHEWTWAVLLFLCFVSGALRFISAYELPQTDISHFAGEELVAEGILVEEPYGELTEEGFVRMRYRVDVRKAWRGKEELSVSGGMYVYGTTRENALEREARIGDVIRMSGRIRLPHGIVICLCQEGERRKKIFGWLGLHRKIIFFAALAGAMFFAGWKLSRPPEVMVAFIDVGQGDAMVVRTVHGHGVMFEKRFSILIRKYGAETAWNMGFAVPAPLESLC